MNKKYLNKILIVYLLIISCMACEPGDSGPESEISDKKSTRSVPVEAMVIRMKPVEQNVTLTGILKPLHEVDLVAEVSGKILKINKEIGDLVGRNDIMAVIDDKILLSNYEHAKAQVLSTEANLDIAKLNLEGDHKLFENGDISELEHQNSELAVKTAEANYWSAKANLSLREKAFNDTKITSPISGHISRKYIDIGTMVMPNTPLFRVVDLNTIELEVGIPQDMIGRIQTGFKAEITVPGLSEQSFTGSVHTISPQAEEKTGAFMVGLRIQNTSDHVLKAGMAARINLMLMEKDSQLVIPNHAVVTKQDEAYTYLIRNGKAHLTKIQTGDVYGTQIMIREGIVSGDTIVIVGMKNLGVETDVIIDNLIE